MGNIPDHLELTPVLVLRDKATKAIVRVFETYEDLQAYLKSIEKLY